MTGRLPLSLHEALEYMIRELSEIKHGVFKTMTKVDEVLEKARQAETVSKSTNIAVKEVIALLKAGQVDPADAQKLDDAKAILEGIIADDSAVLTENTTAEGETEPQA